MIPPMLTPFFAEQWHHKDLFQQAFSIQGTVVRHVKNRRTIRFEQAGKVFYIKIHQKIGWKEIAKNLMQFRFPVYSAADEFLAIQKLESIGIPSTHPAAFSERNLLPVYRESFLVTDELCALETIENVCRRWQLAPPSSNMRHALIRSLAITCAKMHGAGINHRDCYICHFMMHPDSPIMPNGFLPLTVIDLHRAQTHAKIPLRMRMKDLGAMLFSFMEAGLTRRDLLRFMAEYSKTQPIGRFLWQCALAKAKRILNKEIRRKQRRKS